MKTRLRSALRAGACLGAALAAVLSATPARAVVSVPDPRFSTVPTCAGTCPAGDIAFTVVVRDINSAPLGNVSVALDIHACPNLVVTVCPDCPEPAGYNPATKQFSRVTTGAGAATFHLCASMHCPGAAFQWAQVYGNGVLLGSVAVTSPDIDSDGDVDAQDVALVDAAIGGATLPQADEDCNLVIDAADRAVVEAHLGHHCASVVPARPATWGTLKAGYR